MSKKPGENGFNGNRWDPTRPRKFHPMTWTPALGRKILALLEDGKPPFLALTAERAGVNRNTFLNWIKKAEDPAYECPEEFRAWVTEIRRIRAEWMAQAMEFLATCDKASEPAAKQTQFILQRMDQDLFDPPKRMVERVIESKDDAAIPSGPLTAEDLDDLGKPEVMQ